LTTKKTGTTTKKKTTTTKKTSSPVSRAAAKAKPAAARSSSSKVPAKASAKPAPKFAPASKLKPLAKAGPAKFAPAAKPKPLKSPLNKKEMEPYRRLLLELKTKLIRDVQVNQEASNESTDGDVLDLADQASDSYDKDLANSLSEAERGRLASVEHALKRVEEGVYGLCDTCSKPIPLGRLQALPFAKLCVPCQQGEEGLGSRRMPISEE
jgi:DnaK suppressor protein